MTHLMRVHEVGHQIQIPVDGQVLGQQGLDPVQPVHQGLESLCKLAGEQQRLLQLVLPAERRRPEGSSPPPPPRCGAPGGPLPLYALAAHRVPLVADLSHQVVHLLGVCRQLSLVPHGPARPHGGVVHRLLRAQSLLKLLDGGEGEKGL